MATGRGGLKERIRRQREPSYETLQAEHIREDSASPPMDVEIHCGWGRLLMAHTFSDNQNLVDRLMEERMGERDIALYVSNPHVLLSLAPQSLFLDPSDTLRLWMNQYHPRRRTAQDIIIRRMSSTRDVEAVNRIYQQRKMVPLDSETVLESRHSKKVVYLLAETQQGQIVGTVTGVNHTRVYSDPNKGSSLWCLAVSTECMVAGVGEAMVRYLIEYFQARGCQYLDLSVMHDNAEAKALYTKLGFQAIRTFAIKKKNAINERLFVGPEKPRLNPYAQIIIDEALRRGIKVEVDDAERNLFTLIFGGRSIRCNESLSDLTSAITLTLCQDKTLTHRVLRKRNLKTPEHTLYQSDSTALAFLEKHGAIVVKPVDGEQGMGVAVDLRSSDAVLEAVKEAQKYSERVLLETYCPGHDLRIVVIGYEVVAAAIRRPPHVRGDGKHTLRDLIEKQSRRRQAATGGESRIPLDDETYRCIREKGFDWDSVPEAGTEITVRKTANLHTGGTLEDVTGSLNPELAKAAVEAAMALDIPVVGLDFLVPDHEGNEYVIIEANERPGLENHAPQPTAQKFLDLLFPHSHREEGNA